MRPGAIAPIPHARLCNTALYRPSSRPFTIRYAHSIPRPPPSPAKPNDAAEPSSADSSIAQPSKAGPGSYPVPKPIPNYYQLHITCVPCGTPSAHNISKQGYHHGSVFVSCPQCRNRHVISDHLNIFGDRKVTVEDLVREKGGIVRKGTLGADGDIEFWPEEEAASETGSKSS